MEGRIFDAAFVVMPYHKLKAALPEIVKLQASLLVLVGNDVTLAEMEKHIKENAPGVKKILFGFQATGGRRRTAISVSGSAAAWISASFTVRHLQH